MGARRMILLETIQLKQYTSTGAVEGSAQCYQLSTGRTCMPVYSTGTQEPVSRSFRFFSRWLAIDDLKVTNPKEEFGVARFHRLRLYLGSHRSRFPPQCDTRHPKTTILNGMLRVLIHKRSFDCYLGFFRDESSALFKLKAPSYSRFLRYRGFKFLDEAGSWVPVIVPTYRAYLFWLWLGEMKSI